MLLISEPFLHIYCSCVGRFVRVGNAVGHDIYNISNVFHVGNQLAVGIFHFFNSGVNNLDMFTQLWRIRSNFTDIFTVRVTFSRVSWISFKVCSIEDVIFSEISSRRVRASWIWPDEDLVSVLNVRICSATTAKPFPASPARAASIEAFKASRWSGLKCCQSYRFLLLLFQILIWIPVKHLQLRQTVQTSFRQFLPVRQGLRNWSVHVNGFSC